MKQQSKLTVKNHFFPILKNDEILWRPFTSQAYLKVNGKSSNIIEDAEIIKHISCSVLDQYPKPVSWVQIRENQIQLQWKPRSLSLCKNHPIQMKGYTTS